MSSGALACQSHSVLKKLSKKNNDFQTSVSRRSQFKTFPLLTESPEDEHEGLLIQKLRQCCITYDFTLSTVDIEGKKNKEATLNEIIDYVSSYNYGLTEPVYPEILRVVYTNVIRTLPPDKNPYFIPTPDLIDEPAPQTAWPHLSLIYELFLQFLDSPNFNPAIGRKVIDQRFMQHFLELFGSEDPKEREFVKIILHRIYEIFIGLRPAIREQISYIFLRFVYETEIFNGASELLEVLGSIVDGFTLPLRKEHEHFLIKVLMPLHKVKSLPLYHPELSYCVVRLVEKNSLLSVPVVKGLINYWPKTDSQKELLFLGELEEVIEATRPNQFVKLQEVMFKQLANSISSPHSQVSERAFYFWDNDYISLLIKENNSVIMPIMFPALYKTSKTHWNKNNIALNLNVLETFIEWDKGLFDELSSNYREEVQKKKKLEKEREELWKKLDEMDPRNKKKERLVIKPFDFEL